jgi:hypothetical protein
MDEASLREIPRIEKRTAFLAMLANVAMLAGLLGTIVGLIICFGAVATADPSEKATMLAKGISESMNCTAFGLLTAIPGLLFFGASRARRSTSMDDINEASVAVLNRDQPHRRDEPRQALGPASEARSRRSALPRAKEVSDGWRWWRQYRVEAAVKKSVDFQLNLVPVHRPVVGVDLVPFDDLGVDPGRQDRRQAVAEHAE